MAAIDILILIVFAASVIYGLRRGAIRQVGGVLALFAGVLACRLFGDSVAHLMLSLTGSADAPSATAEYSASVLGNLVLYLVVYIGVRLLAGGLRNICKALLLGPIDRILGAVFAVLQWMLGLSLVLNFWAAIFPGSELMAESQLGRGLALQSIMDFAPWLFGSITASGLEI